MRTPILTLFAALALLGAAGRLCAEDAPAPTIEVAGQARNAAELRQLADDVRAALESARIAPGEDPEARREIAAAMTVQVEALQRASELVGAITRMAETLADLKAQNDGVREELAALQAESSKEIQLGEIDEAAVLALEAQGRQRAVDAKTAVDAAAELSAAVEKRKADIDGLPDSIEKLTARGRELQKRLAELPEEEAQKRELLAWQLRTQEVRRGTLMLEQANHPTLLEMDTLRRDRARIRVDLERVRQQIADAKLTQARLIHQKNLAEQERRQKAEARQKLRDAEIAQSPEGRAVGRLKSLVDSMDAALTRDLRAASDLKAAMDDATVLARIAKARLDSARLLFPPGAALETWQQEAMADQLRQLDRDRETYARFRALRMPDIVTRLARFVTERGRLEVFQQRLGLAQDRTDDQAGDGVARIEQELSYSQSDDAKLWLEARLEFIQGQTELAAEEVQRLRASWEVATTRLKAVVQERAENLRKTEDVADKLIQAGRSVEASLEDRRAHLASIALWLRSTPVFTAAYLTEVGRDLGVIGEGLVAAPRDLGVLWQRVRAGEGTSVKLLGALLAALLACLGGWWLRGRIARSAPLARPVVGMDRFARLQRAVAFVIRATILPLLLLGVALYVRAVMPGEILGAVVVGVLLVILGVGLARGLGQVLLASDQNGADDADAATPPSVTRARRALFLAVVGSASFLALDLVLQAASLSSLGHLARLTWGLLFVALGVWLYLRPDVLRALLPEENGGFLARTARSMLRIAWPLAVLLGCAVVVVSALGYRAASELFVQRALWFALALLLVGTVHALLRAYLDRGPTSVLDDDVSDSFDVVAARRSLVRRAQRQLLAVATGVALVVSTSLVFRITSADWKAIGDWSLGGGDAGTGITLGHLLKAIVIFAVTVVVARYARDLIRIVLNRRGTLQKGSRYAIRTLLFYTLVTIGSVIALSSLGLDMAQFGWFLTAAGVGIGFGLQEILSNLVSGLILFFERPVQVGDVVSVGAIEGDVQQINIRSTVVRTRDGVSIILPNKRLITDEVVNWSHGNKRTRLRVQASVAYGSDTALVRSILLKIAKEDDRILNRPAPEVDFVEFGESELQFALYGWLATPDPTLRRRVRSDTNVRIDQLFAEHGITIPFPQRDLHIKSGLPGVAAPDVEPTATDA